MPSSPTFEPTPTDSEPPLLASNSETPPSSREIHAGRHQSLDARYAAEGTSSPDYNEYVAKRERALVDVDLNAPWPVFRSQLVRLQRKLDREAAVEAARAAAEQARAQEIGAACPSDPESEQLVFWPVY